MELFKVICVTCQANLSVRNEALIGQIVGCPRCGSMVEVARPASVASAAVAKPVQNATDAQPASSGSEFAEEALDKFANEVANEVAEEIATDAETTQLAVAETEMLAAQAAVTKYKLIVWSLAGLLAGSALVGTVLLTRRDTNTSAVAPHPLDVKSAPDATAVEPTPNQPIRTIEATDGQPKASDDENTVAPKTEAPEPAVDQRVASLPVNDSVEPPSEVTPTESPSEAPTAESVDREPRVARRFDPLDFDPETLTLATIDAPSTNIESPSTNVETEAPQKTNEATELPEELISTAPSVRRGPDSREDANLRDAAEQLKLLIPAVKIEQMPLVDCLRLFSQLSGVPVSVAPEHLLMAGITPQHKVSLEASETSLGDMLQQLLKPIRLEATTQGSQIILVRQAATKKREINYPIDDLVSESTSTQQLVSWIEQLVAPTTWQSAGGQGTLETKNDSLRITQSQQVQYQVLIMLERLRLARGLPQRSRYPVERLTGTPANQRLQAPLAKQTTFTFSQFTPIDEVFVHWQTALGVPLLVDWPALADADIRPESTVACAIIHEPWTTAFEKILAPLGLGWRATTDGAVEITSAEKVEHEMQLELYPLKPNADVQVEQLSRNLNNSQGKLILGPARKVLFALQPATQQRVLFQQLLHEQLLTTK